MELTRNKLYIILLIACLSGYIWLYFNIKIGDAENFSVEACLLKHATNMPCPACGSTRSVISMLNGDFTGALKINPLGYIIALIMLSTPMWISIDFFTKRKTLFEFYLRIEIFLKNPQYAIPVAALVIANWIWNIMKGL